MHRQILTTTSILRPLFNPVVKPTLKLPCQCLPVHTSGRLPGLPNKDGGYNIIYRALSMRVPGPKKKPLVLQAMTWKRLAVLLGIGGLSVAYIEYAKEQERKASEAQLTRSLGKPDLGGPFTLIDTEGNEVTNETFHGQWVLIYFGFCHCPDICPDQLDKISAITEKINEKDYIPNLQPLFITVDPHRDTKELVKEYLQDFHPSFIGLTGTKAQVKKICKAFRVYFSAGPKDDEEDYIVDHSVIHYLIDPNGDFADYFGQDKKVAEIVSSIAQQMRYFEKEKKLKNGK